MPTSEMFRSAYLFYSKNSGSSLLFILSLQYASFLKHLVQHFEHIQGSPTSFKWIQE
jgi:hypothetical protein